MSDFTIDPRAVLVAMPCGDGRVMAETMGMLISSRNQFAAISLVSECSIVQLARNVIADRFLASPFEWLVSIDSDIVPRPEDLRLLLEPTDTQARYFDPAHPEDSPAGAPPRPTRVSRTPGGKATDSADSLVVAEYAYKNDTLEPVKLGFGFVRIHRSVFEALQKLEHPVDPLAAEYESALEELSRLEPAVSPSILVTLSACRPSPGGGPRLWQGAYNGKIIYDYFPCGPQLSGFVPNAQWKGEDHGFFMLCHLAGIFPRIETRTRLVHIGRKAYEYQGPGTGGGQ